jgi:hypothetical protein
MKGIFQQFVDRVRREARRKPDALELKSMGQLRTFIGYDWGGDTFVMERDVWKQLDMHVPVLIVRKRDLVRGASGYIMTLTTGNHSVAAFPLLSGQFWNLGAAPAEKRSELLRDRFVCANVVDNRIEISQRDVPTALVTAADEWLQSVGMPLDGAIMAERNDETLEFYRRQGQEWRIKPLAWTRQEIDLALRASRTRISSSQTYYHSAKGIHFLSYAEFHKLTQLPVRKFPELVECLREMVSVFEGESSSFMRTLKFHGHHEVELFGVRRGVAEKGIVPELEKLMEGITLKRVNATEAHKRIAAIDAMFKASLERPTLADETSKDFVETLYMHLTGEIYYTHNDLGSLAFDDRRTALPGATFRGGRAEFHPGADERTRVLLANIEQILSQDESLEYANIYEVRSGQLEGSPAQALGEGGTREILFKTNRRPLCVSMIEKRLALDKPGYGSYMLARVHAFKALGVAFGVYRLLLRQDCCGGKVMNYFIRNRCEGEPLDDVPERVFRKKAGCAEEDSRAVLALGALLGNAAAQNLVMKKYIPGACGCRFGVGKEVFGFGYDITLKREVPTDVSFCSIRGCLGWPDLSQTEANLGKIYDFYFKSYAHVLYTFWKKHEQAVTLSELTARFLDGFDLKTREMNWTYTVRREQFDAFDPHLPGSFGFVRKWRFALWALDRQAQAMPQLRGLLFGKVNALAGRGKRGGLSERTRKDGYDCAE